jgi:anti-anti-sigma factor
MTDSFSVSRTDTAHTTVLAFTGALDAATAPDCHRTVMDILATMQPGQSLVIDLRHLQFLAAAGIRVLFRATEQAFDLQVQLSILVTTGQHARKIITIADHRRELPLVDALPGQFDG